MRCLISPSGERSHGISSAGMTFGRFAYSLRNSSDLTISSARQLHVLVPERACCLSSIAAICAAPEALEHDPEKWKPVFGKDHAQTKSLEILGWRVGPERGIEIGR